MRIQNITFFKRKDFPIEFSFSKVSYKCRISGYLYRLSGLVPCDFHVFYGPSRSKFKEGIFHFLIFGIAFHFKLNIIPAKVDKMLDRYYSLKSKSASDNILPEPLLRIRVLP